jgi:hypothetical protein
MASATAICEVHQAPIPLHATRRLRQRTPLRNSVVSASWQEPGQRRPQRSSTLDLADHQSQRASQLGDSPGRRPIGQTESQKGICY